MRHYHVYPALALAFFFIVCCVYQTLLSASLCVLRKPYTGFAPPYWMYYVLPSFPGCVHRDCSCRLLIHTLLLYILIPTLFILFLPLYILNLLMQAYNTICFFPFGKLALRLQAVAVFRLARIEGIVETMMDGPDASRARKAHAATARLRSQLAEMQLAEVALGAQVPPSHLGGATPLVNRF